MINRINAARRAVGLAPLAENGRLGQAAAKHAADLAANPWLIDSGRFHEGSDGSTVRARVVAEGYAPAWFGEVVGWGFADADPTVTAGEYDRMVNWWLASPHHRAMLLSPHYDEAGAGYVYRPGSQWGHYYCVVFGKRAGVVNPPAPPKPPGDVVYVPVVVGGREVPPTGVVDLLGYLRGDGRAYRVTNADGGSEVFQTQAEGDRFYQVKAWRAGLASPVETDEDVLIDLMLQRAPLSVESIRLKVEFVEPRFQWSNEVEIDPFDELD